MSNTKKIKAGLVLQDPSEFIGQAGTIFYNPDTGTMYLSDGVTPGGILLGQSSGGSGFSGNYNDLTSKPNLNVYATTVYVDNITTWANISGKPSLATVATSGSYDDLTNKPTIPSITGLASETFVTSAISGKANTSDLSLVATSGSYIDLTNKPTIPTDIANLTDTGGLLGQSGTSYDQSLNSTDNVTFNKITLPHGNITSEFNSGIAVNANLEAGDTFASISAANNTIGYQSFILAGANGVAANANGFIWSFNNTGDLVLPGNLNYNGTASPAPSINGFSSATFVDKLTTSKVIAGNVQLGTNITGDVPQAGYYIVVATTWDDATPDEQNPTNTIMIADNPENRHITSGWTMATADNTVYTVTNAFPIGPGWQVVFSPAVTGYVSGSSFWPLTFTSPDYVAASSHSLHVTTNNKTWTFSTDGSLTLPGPIDNISVGTASITGTRDPAYPTVIDLTKSINKLSDNTGSYYTLADGTEGQIMYLVRQRTVTDLNLSSIGIHVANAYYGLNQLADQVLYFNSDIITLIFTDGAWQQSGGSWD